MQLDQQTVFNILLTQANYLAYNVAYFKNSSINTRQMAEVGLAIVAVETGGKYDPNLKSKSSTAKGLMQILKGTKESMERNYLKVKVASDNKMYDANYNCLIGLTYLGYLYKQYGDWKKAVIAYNQGHYNTSKAGIAYYNRWADYHQDFAFDELYQKANPDYSFNGRYGSFWLEFV